MANEPDARGAVGAAGVGAGSALDVPIVLLERPSPAFKRIADGAAGAVLLVGDDVRLLLVAPGLARLLGYAPDELTAMTSAMLLHPDDGEVVAGLVADVRGHEATRRGVARLLTRDGRTLVADLEGSILERSARGAVVAVVATVRDPVRGFAADLRGLADRSPDALFRFALEPTMRLEYLSAAAEQMLGVDVASLLGDPQVLLALLDPDDEVRLLRVIDPQTSDGRPAVVRWRHAGGATVWTEVRTTVVTGRDGRAVAVEGVARDVTAQVVAEAALQQEHRRTLLLHDAVVAVNESADVDEALRRTLEVLTTHLGWPLATAFLLDGDGTLTPAASHVARNADRRLQRLHRRSETFRPTVGEALVGAVAAGGTPVVVEDVTSDPRFQRGSDDVDFGARSWIGFPVLCGQEVAGVVELFADEVTDVDERLLDALHDVGTQLGRAVERQRVEAQLADVDAVKTDFVSRAAHELRNPVGTLAVAITTLLDRGDRLGEADRRRLLVSADRALARLRGLIGRLLDLADLEAGGAPLAVTSFDAADVMAGVIADLPPLVGRQVDFVAPSGVRVLADELALAQILENLIMNAWRHGGPHIGVHVIAEDAETACIEVVDDGPGVPPELATSLFEPFARGRTARDEEGFGLGLAISRRLGAGFDARLTYEAVDPHGSRFELRVRRVRP